MTQLQTIIGKLPAKKRGRKSKKEIEEALKLSKNQIAENIVVNFEESVDVQNDTSGVNDILISDYNDDNTNNTSNTEKPIPKKRGRKPKGGKIIQQVVPFNNNIESKPNIILHLKCSIKDLNSNLFGSSLEGFSFSNSNMTFDIINNENDSNTECNQPQSSTKVMEHDGELDSIDYEFDLIKNKDNDNKDIWKKLKVLQNNLHFNRDDNKKSACFWDTCEFDNHPVYIPKFFMGDTYHVYGCFCSPECAVAHLMEENIDSSVKFERYQLINHLYSKVYNYNKNIKPSPNPYYMLEKYYGNLTIQDYRSLLRNERLFLIVDKPLTCIMPELHEDNDDFIINNKIIPSNTYQVKKKLQKKQTKNNILNERFGLLENV